MCDPTHRLHESDVYPRVDAQVPARKYASIDGRTRIDAQMDAR